MQVKCQVLYAWEIAVVLLGGMHTCQAANGG